MASCEVKGAIIAAGLKLYQVADELGIADTSLSRKLRNGMSEEDTKKVFEVIEKLKAKA